jgi:cobalamin biosynthetic protein CobC
MNGRETLPQVIDALRYHGGNLAAARALFPDAPEPWIDLSTGINPVPYPIGTIEPSIWARLPDPADLTDLEAAARDAYGASPHVAMVAAPGTQAIIQWLPRIISARRVGILGPTYGEHEKTWRAAGAEVIAATTLGACEGCDVVVVVNPNNPDGRLFQPDALAETAAALAARGGMLVVDEAFMDVIDPAMSLIPVLPETGAVVLRSFGKTYGLAGIRLGFVAGPQDVVAQLRAALGPWAVPGPPIEIGRRALRDRRWLCEAVHRLSDDARRLDALLQAAGFVLQGGTPLFRLVRCEDAGRQFERLCRAGILTRPFDARRDLLRFGIPAGSSAWMRLETALRS